MWSHKLQQGVLLLPVSPPKKEVHHRVVFTARIAALKNISLSSSLVKDWIVCSWCKISQKGAEVRRNVCQGVNEPCLYLSAFLCLLPECPCLSWTPIYNLKTLPTTLHPLCIPCDILRVWNSSMWTPGPPQCCTKWTAEDRAENRF